MTEYPIPVVIALLVAAGILIGLLALAAVHRWQARIRPALPPPEGIYRYTGPDATVDGVAIRDGDRVMLGRHGVELSDEDARRLDSAPE